MRLTKPTLFTNMPVTCENRDLPDLQTSSQRLNLSASNNAVTELKPESCIDDAGEKLYFRKFFKFQVLKPLDVKTKFYNAETDEVFLEAQIQNITTLPMFMEKVSLEPSMMYNVTELNTVETGDVGTSTFGKMSYLQPMDTRQYLYCLKPKPEFAEKAGVIKGVTVIGKLDIVWKTNLGERGRLQTSQLQRMAPGYGDVRLSLEMIPDTVNLEEPFDITCKITNCSERTMDLVLEMCNTCSIHWCGVSGRQLGKSISGLRLTDTFLKRTYEYDDIAQYTDLCGSRVLLSVATEGPAADVVPQLFDQLWVLLLDLLGKLLTAANGERPG
ncbi:unnamed protein product, partial [Coregonus sp. 'balchen']